MNIAGYRLPLFSSLILWAIVFAFWLVRQFAEHNKRKDK